MQDYLSPVLFKFVKHLNARVTFNTIQEELLKHPNYPSLLAVSDVLNSWKIPNAAYNIPFESLNEVEDSYMAVFQNEIVVVLETKKNGFIISTSKKSNFFISQEDFKTRYNGSVLLAEIEANSGETEYKIHRRKEILNQWRYPFLITGCVLILVYMLTKSLLFTEINYFVIALFLCKAMGVVVTALLLLKSIDADNPFVQKLCAGKNNDCNAILSSNAANVTEGLSWSEVGFFYFAGTWLVLLFNGTHAGILHTLAILNILCLPYSFYSIYYQWRIAKQWCIFCLSVQALLWLEFAGFWPYLTNYNAPIFALQWLGIVTAMLVPLLLWSVLKPLLLTNNQILPLKIQLQRFKYNDTFFHHALHENKAYPLLDDSQSIVLGNREAENIVTIVSNPYCGPCAKAHKQLDTWLKQNDKIKLQIVFSGTEEGASSSITVAKHFMGLYSSGNINETEKAINSWYSQKNKDYGSWAKKHPLDNSVNDNIMKAQKKWCDITEITATPTIFINGRQLPKQYQPTDIKYFI